MMLQNVENVLRLRRTLLKRDVVMCYYKTYDFWATHFLALVKGES